MISLASTPCNGHLTRDHTHQQFVILLRTTGCTYLEARPRGIVSPPGHAPSAGRIYKFVYDESVIAPSTPTTTAALLPHDTTLTTSYYGFPYLPFYQKDQPACDQHATSNESHVLVHVLVTVRILRDTLCSGTLETPIL